MVNVMAVRNATRHARTAIAAFVVVSVAFAASIAAAAAAYI